jgi:hypothetical protein
MVKLARLAVVFAALLSLALVAASPPKDLDRLFARKPPWEYPRLKAPKELRPAIAEAMRDYHGRRPDLKIQFTGSYHDPRRDLAFLTFGIAEDSRTMETDFFLVYVYDRSTRRLLGHVFINMA